MIPRRRQRSDLCSRAVDAVLFGALAGVLFGAYTVAIRYGLSRGVPVEVGATVSATLGLVVVAFVALVTGAFADDIDRRDVLVFAAIGAVVPGISQVVFVSAVRHAGAARTAVLVGVAPLLSFVLAAVFLRRGRQRGPRRRRRADRRRRRVDLVRADEARGLSHDRGGAGRRLRRPLRDPRHARPLGLGGRDDGAAAPHGRLARRGRDRRRRVGVRDAPRTDRTWTCAPQIKPFLPAGIILGGAYLCLIVALDRGRVTIVAPLNATQSLWGVIFAALFLGRREAIGPRLVAAAVVIVAGGVLIGINR